VALYRVEFPFSREINYLIINKKTGAKSARFTLFITSNRLRFYVQIALLLQMSNFSNA
jgi:hypothetical protein